MKGRKHFIFNSSQPDMIFHEPLVLIDWVAIDNVEKIMAVSPSRIDRVEFVDVPYIKGNMIYGGIISVISRNGDVGGIDLPSSGIFLNYGFVNVIAEQNAGLVELTGPHLPDTRNTLVWEPEIPSLAGNEYHVSFRAADTKGTYIVIIRGIGRDGKFIYGSCTFNIE